MDDFEFHAAAELKAEAIIVCVDAAAQDRLLLATAYTKRIRPVPTTVHQRAVRAFKQAAKTAKVKFDNPAQASLVMDKVCDAFWNQLNDEDRRAWLLKVD